MGARPLLVHFPFLPDDVPQVGAVPTSTHSMCGLPLLSRASSTLDIAHVTCEDCAIRCVAVLQNQISTLLKTIAGRVVALRAAAESAVKRD